LVIDRYESEDNVMPQSLSRALVADSHSLSVVGISEIFQNFVGMGRVVHVESFARLCAILDADPHWDLLTLELSLPGLSALVGLRFLRAKYSKLRIAIVSNDSERSTVLGALAEGAHGYIPKDLPVKEIANALRLITEGHIYVPDRLADLTPSAGNRSSLAMADFHLTERQQDVLGYLRKGYSNKEIARALGITESTVKVHMASAYRHLGVHNRASAVSALEGVQFEHRAVIEAPVASHFPRASQAQRLSEWKCPAA
jgi:DNA-binding NarL/FixJ family response regulator